jgi:biopolymer transport protein ExbB
MSFSFLLQANPQGGSELTGTKEVPVWDIIQSSNAGVGWLINLLLVLMLGYVIFIFVERFLALRKASNEEKGFLSKIKDYIAKGDIEKAKLLCASSGSPSARMLEKGISRIGKPLDNISASIENTGKLEILRLEQRISFLGTASGAAPMLGFLGTVIGMVVVFIDLQNTNKLEIMTIAPGIMTAMVTTISGLIVGIVAFMGYNYLVARIGTIVYQMESTALEFMDLLHEPGK